MKVLAKLRELFARVPLRRTLFGLVVVGAVVSVGFLYKELSSIRRDLYAVRTDYYAQPAQEEYVDDQAPTIELLSQSVKTLRVEDYDATTYKEEYTGPEYKKEQVREVIARVKNNYDYIYSFGGFGYAGPNGVVQRPITVHPDDDQNNSTENGSYIELAPGGEATIFIYFKDKGTSIEKLINIDNYGI